jgi:hypothetical protein
VNYGQPPLSMPAWDHVSHDPHHVDPLPTGSKRSHESISVEDFLLDVKKRKVAPTYDPRMFRPAMHGLIAEDSQIWPSG